MNELFVIFVPYGESLQLKELGFDELTLYHWHKSCKTHPFTNEVFNPNCRPRTNSAIKSIGEENHVWSAPTFSQAFRWFREKYKLHSTITSISQESWQWHITKPGESLGKLYDEDFYSYEEAELGCLRKLIEIVNPHKLPDLTWKDASEEEIKSKQLKSMKGKRL